MGDGEGGGRITTMDGNVDFKEEEKLPLFNREIVTLIITRERPFITSCIDLIVVGVVVVCVVWRAGFEEKDKNSNDK